MEYSFFYTLICESADLVEIAQAVGTLSDSLDSMTASIHNFNEDFKIYA